MKMIPSFGDLSTHRALEKIAARSLLWFHAELPISTEIRIVIHWQGDEFMMKMREILLLSAVGLMGCDVSDAKTDEAIMPFRGEPPQTGETPYFTMLESADEPLGTGGVRATGGAPGTGGMTTTGDDGSGGTGGSKMEGDGAGGSTGGRMK